MREAASSLSDSLNRGQPVVGVIGLGYAGLPLAAAFVEGGAKVVGFDIDPCKVEALRQGKSYLRHGGLNLAGMFDSDRFSATTDMDRLREVQAILICVPTPLDAHQAPDLQYVRSTVGDVASRLQPGQLVVLESTSYPGTTRQEVLPALEATGLGCGRDFYLAFSPEREDPGRQDRSTKTIPKLVGGVDAESGELARRLYRLAVDRVILVDRAEVAEAAKLLENIYRAVNIAMVNELKLVFERLDLDIWEVIEAAATKDFGFQAFYPGPGSGGHCVPVDPYYLSWKARAAGVNSRFIELAGEVNRAMPGHVVQRLLSCLNAEGKAVSRCRILILGLAYKPDVDDCRESPSLSIADALRALGAEVDYNDPHVPEAPRTRSFRYRARSEPLSPAMLASYDATVICTAHSAYDWNEVARCSALVVDTRNALANITNRAHIHRA